MASHKRILRGVRDIRTLSGRVDAGSVPYMGYMKIASLEMERARRLKEKNSALHRIGSIDARFCDIDAEKDRLLRALGDRVAGNSPGRAPSSSARRMDCRTQPGVRIKY